MMNQPDIQPVSEPLFPSLSALLSDPAIFEIMIDGYARVYVESRGVKDVPSPYRDNAHLMSEVTAFADYMGLSTESPILEGWLPDGSRVNIVLPPVSPIGPALNIRKYQMLNLTGGDLLRFGAWDEAVKTFLEASVRAGLNIIVAGGTGSGKTTILNVLAAMCDPEERLINIGGEARLTHRRTLVLEPRQSINANGGGEITMFKLVNTAIRMRPDRLILTELQGPETLPFIEALNLGYNGALATMSATNPREALSRLETLASMGNPSLSLLTIRELIASGIHLIVSQQRLRDGVRRILKVSEIVGMQGDTINIQDIFVFQSSGYENATVKGHFTATGTIPRCLEAIRDANVDLPLSLFTPQ